MILQKRKASFFYILNANLLITHEIDSAYWHEWNLFNLPGGITAFLIINFLLICLVFLGYSQVVLAKPNTRKIFSMLACVGIFTFIIHIVFIAPGQTEFRTISSLGLLASILIVSILQLGNVIFTRPESCKSGKLR